MLIPDSSPDYGRPLQPRDAAVVGATAPDAVEPFLANRAGNAPTPLHTLPGLASELSIATVHIKDESQRLGAGSFKALGGATAVVRLALEEAERQLGRPTDPTDLDAPEFRAVARKLVFTCATSGNHGRSVAAGARSIGARAVIIVHGAASPGRVAAIRELGAEVVHVSGTFDDAVAEVSRRSREERWVLAADTARPGFERIPGMVMQGYTVLVRESLRVLAEPPTHVFVQAGVGGLAGAVAGHLADALGDARPRLIVVEPSRAACLLESARAGRPVRIPRAESTALSMLACYEPSVVAWRILSRTADVFMTVDEDDAADMVRRLARPAGADPAIIAGESGAAGLAGLARAAADEELRAAIGLDERSRVLAINTEGAIDRARFREIVGLSPEEISSEQEP